MLATIEKRPLLKVLAVSSCGLLFSMAALTADVTAETLTIITVNTSDGVSTVVPGTENTTITTIPITTIPITTIPTTTIPTTPTLTAVGSCLYSLQLANDTSLREAFLARVTLVNQTTNSSDRDDSDLYQTSIDVTTTRAAKTSGIDSLSHDCLSCHDGVMATSFNVRIKNNPAGRVMSLEDIIGGHPVGMEYDRYVSFNSREYRQEVTFSREMVFAEGKVGCLTCHNPLNIAKGHLVINNDRSGLCFACHNK